MKNKQYNHNDIVSLTARMKDAAIDPQHPKHQILSEWAGIEIGSSGHNSIRAATKVLEIADREADHFLALLKKGSWEDFVRMRPVIGLAVLAVIAKTDENASKNARKLQAQIAGKATKRDSLQKLIISIVRKKPAISERELLEKLKENRNHGVIEDIDDEEISFTNDKGNLDTSPITGLKDRLFRAKKELRLSIGKKA